MSVNKTAKVNHRAVDTWLEPYIGTIVDVVQIRENVITFQLDYGGDNKETRSDNILFFDILN